MICLLTGATFSWFAVAGATAVATRVDMASASRPPLATSEVSAPTGSIGAPRDEHERARGPRRTRVEARGDIHDASSACRDGGYRRAGVCDARGGADATFRTARDGAVEVPETPLPTNGHKDSRHESRAFRGAIQRVGANEPGIDESIGNVYARAAKCSGRAVRPTDAFLADFLLAFF